MLLFFFVHRSCASVVVVTLFLFFLWLITFYCLHLQTHNISLIVLLFLFNFFGLFYFIFSAHSVFSVSSLMLIIWYHDFIQCQREQSSRECVQNYFVTTHHSLKPISKPPDVTHNFKIIDFSFSFSKIFIQGCRFFLFCRRGKKCCITCIFSHLVT